MLSSLFFLMLSGWAAQYKLDPKHTSVGFEVTHMVIASVPGSFSRFDGGFEFDEKKQKLSDLEVKIQMDSISTNDADRDSHLKSSDFFNVAQFPQMEFKSNKVEFKNKKPSKIHGELTLHGVKKPVVLNVVYKGSIVDFKGLERLGFEATTKIDRFDYGMTWSKNLDKGGLVVGKEVTISIKGEAIKQVPPPAA